MHRLLRTILLAVPISLAATGARAADTPDCSRPLTLALHEHGLLYSSASGTGIDRDMADELALRSGCRISVTVQPRARIWQLIESGALDFSLSGIANPERDRFASFAWYFSNKYYLLVRKDAGVQRIEDFERHDALHLGVIRSFRYSASANRLVDRLQEARRVSQAAGFDPLYQVLQSNRIQGMIIEPFDFPETQSARLRELALTIEFSDAPVPHGLIMSKASVPPAEQEKWRRLVQAMRADGTVLRIFQKYFPRDLAQTMVNF